MGAPPVDHDHDRPHPGGGSEPEIGPATTVRNVTSAALRRVAGRNRFDAARIAQELGWL